MRQRTSRPAEVVPGLAARQEAVQILAAVLDRGRIPDEARLPGTAPERAEAQSLADLAFRRLGEIDAGLARLVARMPRPPVIHVLRVMAAELAFGRGAAHAAVDLAVRQVKAGPSAKLSGLVNAVGRRLAGGALTPLEGAEAARANTPSWLARRLEADWGPQAEAIMAAHLAAAPIDLTLRAAADAGPLATELGAEWLPTGGLRLATRPQISALPGFEAGAWWVQDAAASLPVQLMAPRAGERVLDLCAAPGGKTLQLAAAGARVTALDISEARLGRLRENLSRTGLGAETVAADALAWEPEAPFDAILIDAPCSATGTIRRHPDLPHRFDPRTLPDLLALQERLIDRAWGWLAPGGRLVFATCSLFRAEGEDQADRLAATGADPLPADLPFAREGRIRTLPSDWPDRGGLDGFFAAAFRRPP